MGRFNNSNKTRIWVLTYDLLPCYFSNMTSISISKLKENPSKAIYRARDYPLAVENRHKVEAYLIGKDLYEKIIDFVENYIDHQAVLKDDETKGRDFEEVVKELGL